MLLLTTEIIKKN